MDYEKLSRVYMAIRTYEPRPTAPTGPSPLLFSPFPSKKKQFLKTSTHTPLNRDVAAEANGRAPTAVLRHDGQDLVDAAHAAAAPFHQALNGAADPSGWVFLVAVFRGGALAEHLAPFPDPHAFEPGALLDGAVDLDAGAGGQGGGGERAEVDVGADVDLARVRERRDESVGPNAAEGGGGDGGRGPVVEDQRCAGRVRFCWWGGG